MARFNFWRRDIVLVASSLPAVLSFIINIFAIVQLGVASFGKWMVWRSACQLTANINPGFSAALTLWLPRIAGRNSASRRHNENAAINVALFSTALWGGAFGFCFFILLKYVFALASEDIVALVFFWLGLFWLGFMAHLARAKESGKALLAGSLGNIVGTGVTLIVLVLDLGWSEFVLANALRIWLQVLGLYLFCWSSYKALSALTFFQLLAWVRRLIGLGLPLVTRGWAQTAAQYSDRLIIGILFGSIYAGAAGIGSTFALPLVMVTSAVAAWALPLMMRSEEGVNKTIDSLICSLAIAGLAGAMILPKIVPIMLSDSNAELAQIVCLGYYITAIVSFVNITLLPLIVKKRLWQSTGVQLALVVVLWLVLYLSDLFSLSLFLGLAIAAHLLTIGVICLCFWQGYISGRVLWAFVLLPTIITIYSKFIWVISSSDVISWLSAVAGFVFGAWALHRIFWTKDQLQK